MSERPAPPHPSIDRVTMIPPDGKPVGWASIAGEAHRQAARLAGTGPVVNLCEDRLAFLVTLLATALAGRETILPSDRSPASLSGISSIYESAPARYDNEELARGVSTAGLHGEFYLPAISDSDPQEELDLASIEDARIVMFTSGSTGKPEPCARALSFFLRGADANAECMMEGLGAGAGIVATVPPYHMFGIELSVLVPLLKGGAVYSGRPFYPRDIAAALNAVEAPRILISTPVHLRILKESGIETPPVARVFSATAPLPARLAGDIEEMLGADLREIFGTTETGSIGWRNTAREESFHLLHGMELTQQDDISRISAPHISPPFVLPDRLASTGDGDFRIAGRSNDIVNIAGKRMSLAGLNAIMAGLDGVMDGAFLAPDDDVAGPVRRMIAFVAAPGLSVENIRSALRDKLDSAFIPRRVIFVDSLPRNAAGKLPLHEFRRFALATLACLDGAQRVIRYAADEPFFADHFPDDPIVPGAVLLGEASELLCESLGGLAGPVELVSARFPDSARPGEDCLFRMDAGANGQFRIECTQGGRTVMKAAMRMLVE
ncbi:MAG: acyl-CoA synthetase [Proteobacteria bacterium]|nr:acyl-CoA synthetase [Pseudomonadota bacterium]